MLTHYTIYYYIDLRKYLSLYIYYEYVINTNFVGIYLSESEIHL